ncbi:serine O-acetyltransferase [Singulisphaera sp. PoT]|uniref:serine O-acetyltransferase n=1 Tax=Singulisphaera sp. PoT TaxID=3411797 RepID=UPI003BF55C13
MFNCLRQDIWRCGDTAYVRAREIALTPAMWAVIGYRFRRWLYTASMPRPIRVILNVLAVLVQTSTQIATNIELPSSTEIGPGLYLPHTGYIVVSSRAIIGSNCTLTQGVTIGHGGGGRGSRHGVPTLGDRVYVGPGAAIIGPVTIGSDALIGAGAIVTRSIPPRGVAVGNPARVISDRGSFDLIEYPGMETDPDRLVALSCTRSEPSGCAAIV